MGLEGLKGMEVSEVDGGWGWSGAEEMGWVEFGICEIERDFFTVL